MKKRIGIDCHVFDGIYQGSRTHIVELLSRAISLSENIEYFLFLENIRLLKEVSQVFRMSHVNMVYMPAMHPLKRLGVVLPHLQRKYLLDLFHAQYIIPIINYVPCITTIHDILFETHPQYFTYWFNLRSKVLVKSSARRSSHIITVSEYTKRELINLYHIDSDKITVSHNGVNTTIYCPGTDQVEVVKKRGLLSKRYILSVGRLEPRKNHISLLKAYARLGSKAPPLVIVGQRDFMFKGIYDTVNSLKLTEKIVFLDDVSSKELPALYRHATLFVYPSWAEGFGIPPLEAMASGVPVICSNTTACPEIVGEAAILVDPNDCNDMARSMKMVIDDVMLQRRMSERGRIRSMLYTWDAAAQRTLDAYRIALERYM